MEVHVSLDVYGGRVVRMKGGDPSTMKVYSQDPLAKGLEILEEGITRIHLVDLEAALSGKRVSSYVLRLAEALKRVGGFVTVGGGIRGIGDLELALQAGADRVVLGTALYLGLIDLGWALELGGGRLVAAADTKAGRVVYAGWRRVSQASLVEVLEGLRASGFSLFLVTDTARDGSLEGVDRSLIESVPKPLRGQTIYSGGVSSTRDLKVLAQAGFLGVVVGRAYYEGVLGAGELARFEGASDSGVC